MIPYSRDPAKTIPPSSVKIIGLGGAGANMLERIALDGMEGTELIALNTDIRTLSACIAKEKIQLGANLTKGLGAGGDPELGNKAVLEAEDEIRASLKDHKIVFICAGLGGGTGSGAAPIVTRIAREEGAFVVVFATTPFAFEGDRRRDQAETALNELAVLSNALVTFDNNRMGELVLAKQGIHEAFTAADQMISESIKSVIRLVVRPGLINVGLDELMTALKTNRSRCLFGSGMADGADRASKALRSALASPLLDEGSLLKDAQSVLVHLCGGEDLTLFEVELLMQQLQKHVPEKAQVLFGAAIDPALGGSLSVTLISALPEEALAKAPRKSISQAEDDSPLVGQSKPAAEPTPATKTETKPEPKPEPEPEPKAEAKPEPTSAPATEEEPGADSDGDGPNLFDDKRPFAEPSPQPKAEPSPQPKAEPSPQPKVEPAPEPEAEPAESEKAPIKTSIPEPKSAEPHVSSIPPKRDEGAAPWGPKSEAKPAIVPKDVDADEEGPAPDAKLEPIAKTKAMPVPASKPEAAPKPEEAPKPEPEPEPEPVSFKPKPEESKPEKPAIPAKVEATKDDELDAEIPKLKLGGGRPGGDADELSLDSSPRGRFEGEDPNVVDGEDLDLPPFLRKKK